MISIKERLVTPEIRNIESLEKSRDSILKFENMQRRLAYIGLFILFFMCLYSYMFLGILYTVFISLFSFVVVRYTLYGLYLFNKCSPSLELDNELEYLTNNKIENIIVERKLDKFIVYLISKDNTFCSSRFENLVYNDSESSYLDYSNNTIYVSR